MCDADLMATTPQPALVQSVRWDYVTGRIGPTTVTVEWCDHESGPGWVLDAIGPDGDWHVNIVGRSLGTRTDIWSAMAEASRIVLAAGA